MVDFCFRFVPCLVVDLDRVLLYILAILGFLGKAILVLSLIMLIQGFFSCVDSFFVIPIFVVLVLRRFFFGVMRLTFPRAI